MKETTIQLIRKFEKEHGVAISATDAQAYWIVSARIPRTGAPGTRWLHHGIHYVSGRNQEGTVLVLNNPFLSGTCRVESWGSMGTFDDFVIKALARIVEERMKREQEQGEGCGTSCG